MRWRLAKSLMTLREQVNQEHPLRSKVSDGALGNAEHSSRTSDHNINSQGVVCAIDITHDPANGFHSRNFADALVASRDPRIKYCIAHGQICSSKQQPWVWRKYKGANGHFHHVHISVVADRGLYDDVTPWDFLGQSSVHPPVDADTTALQPELREGSKGEAVKRLQLALRAHGSTITVDGDFGLATKKAVIGFQAEKSLRPDGIVGRQTWKALGL